jgi:hypothetical protein
MGRDHSIECEYCGASYGGFNGPDECPCTGRTPSIDSIAPPLPGDDKRCGSCGVEHFVARCGIDREAWNVAMWNLGEQKLRADRLTAENESLRREVERLKEALDNIADVLKEDRRSLYVSEATTRAIASENARLRGEVLERTADRAALRATVERMRRVVDVARRVVSRGIHRRNRHRDIMLREVTLLPNDIEILGTLANAIDAAEQGESK